MRRVGLTAAAALLLVRAGAGAEPTLWQRVTDPGARSLRSKARLRAEQLYAEQFAEEQNDTRVDLDAAQHLSLDSAALLELSGGANRDPWQAVLLGRVLLDTRTGREAQAMALIEHGVSALPDSDFKGSSLFDLGLAATFSGDMDRATKAFTAALALAWDSDDRANLLRNRGKSLLLAGRLAEAVTSFRAAVRAARAPDVMALSHFGLGAALERSGDYPQGLQEDRARRCVAAAGSAVRGRKRARPTRSAVLSGVRRALLPRARPRCRRRSTADSSEREQDRYASRRVASWEQYLPAAEAANDRFLPNARRHEQRCLDALAKLKTRSGATHDSRGVR